MGRLPKKITTHTSPRLTLKIWVWIAVGMVFVVLYAYYNIPPFQPVSSFTKETPVVEEPTEVIDQMEESTPQDLQALPIGQETAEEAIAIADLKNDELVKIFDSQEQTKPKTDSKPKAPVAVKRSLGLV